MSSRIPDSLRNELNGMKDDLEERNENYEDDIEDILEENDWNIELYWDSIGEAAEYANSRMNHEDWEKKYSCNMERAVRAYVIGSQKRDDRPTGPSGPTMNTSSPF